MSHKKIRPLALLAILASPSPASALPAAQVADPSFVAPLAANVGDDQLKAPCAWVPPVMGSPSVAPVNARYSGFDAAARINRTRFLGISGNEQASPFAPGSIVTVPFDWDVPFLHVIGIGNVYAPDGGVSPNVSRVEISNSTVIIQKD